MKKKLIIILSALVALTLVFALFACAKKHVHNYTEEYRTSSDGHWYECQNENCDKPQIEYGEHVDADKNGACDMCGYSMSVPAEEVSLDKTSLTLEIGETYDLSARIAPENATEREVKYLSENPNIASVSFGGVVTAENPGKTKIIATVGKVSAFCEVTVTAGMESVSLNASEITLTVDGSFTLVPEFTPANAENKNVTYSVAPQGVVSVTKDGLVTGLTAGTATVTVTTEDGGYTANCKFNVIIPVTSVTISGIDRKEITMTKGETKALTATVLPENATDKSILWLTDKNKDGIITLDKDGNLTAVGAGTIEIIAESRNGVNEHTVRDSFVLTVISPVTGVSFTDTEITLKKTDAPIILEPVFAPADASNKGVSYSVEPAGVVTVDELGTVRPVDAGTATVTVTTDDGGFTAQCEITVVIPVTGVSLAKTEATIGRGQTLRIAAAVAPENATNKNVTWSISPDNKGISVGSDGLITAASNAEGPVTLTVTTEDGEFTAFCILTISIPVTGVSVGYGTSGVTGLYLTMGVRDNYQLTAKVSPSNASNKNVSWESMDETVVTVDESGKVTATGAGSTTVKVTTEDGNFSATSVRITVNTLLIFEEYAESCAVKGINEAYENRVVIPATYKGKPVTSILGGAFSNQNRDVRSIQIPASVISIGESIFYYDRYNTAVYYEGTLAQWCAIPDVSGLYNNNGPSTLVINCNDNDNKINLMNESVTSIEIPDGVESIGKRAFFRSNLTEIFLPASLKSVGQYAFENYKNHTVRYKGDISGWVQIDGLEYVSARESGTAHTVILNDDTNINALETVKLSDGVTAIKSKAFANCAALTTLITGPDVTEIASDAFTGASSLQTVYFGGDKTKWDAISDKPAFSGVEIYTYREQTPTTEGNFWHYDTDGVTPVVWTEIAEIEVTDIIFLYEDKVALDKGQKIKLSAYAWPEDAADQTLVWTTDNAAVEITNDDTNGNTVIISKTLDCAVSPVTVTIKNESSGVTKSFQIVDGAYQGKLNLAQRSVDGSKVKEWKVSYTNQGGGGALEELVIPSHAIKKATQDDGYYPVTKIGTHGLEYYPNLKKVYIPSTVKTISPDGIFKTPLSHSISIYYDITFEASLKINMEGFYHGLTNPDDVKKIQIYFKNPETGEIDVNIADGKVKELININSDTASDMLYGYAFANGKNMRVWVKSWSTTIPTNNPFYNMTGKLYVNESIYNWENYKAGNYAFDDGLKIYFNVEYRQGNAAGYFYEKNQSWGYIEREMQYDSNGNLIEEIRYDSNGNVIE